MSSTRELVKSENIRCRKAPWKGARAELQGSRPLWQEAAAGKAGSRISAAPLEMRAQLFLFFFLNNAREDVGGAVSLSCAHQHSPCPRTKPQSSQRISEQNHTEPLSTHIPKGCAQTGPHSCSSRAFHLLKLLRDHLHVTLFRCQGRALIADTRMDPLCSQAPLLGAANSPPLPSGRCG